ncbi:hypothetical protein [Dictyobacter kobayashii]|uniref:hypothetical protein n=1 Tax=Dictyobacter kobayashii TaxID=2014872 RepID=UPI000F82840C|nr:hypothetical protein [Dictyobacter kobayashii]
MHKKIDTPLALPHLTRRQAITAITGLAGTLTLIGCSPFTSDSQSQTVTLTAKSNTTSSTPASSAPAPAAHPLTGNDSSRL